MSLIGDRHLIYASWLCLYEWSMTVFILVRLRWLPCDSLQNPVMWEAIIDGRLSPRRVFPSVRWSRGRGVVHLKPYCATCSRALTVSRVFGGDVSSGVLPPSKKKSQLKGRDPFYVGFFWTEGVVGMDEGFMTVNIEKLYGTAWCLESEARGEKKRKKERKRGRDTDM